MSETTPVLGLQLTAAGQAQKHVTVNEALLKLDALVHLSVIEQGRNAPPTSPAEGDRYLVGSAPTGAFAGHAGAVARYDAGAWSFLSPRTGWRAYVTAQNALLVYNGTDWVGFSPTGAITELQNLGLLGLGTTADASNPLSVRANAALLTAKSTPGGTGDLRLKLNKDAAGNTASQIFQTGYSGRAEIGLIGDDRFGIKVSADGSTWRQALVIDQSTGVVSAPQGISASLSFSAPPQGRLTLASATPVMTASVSGAGTLYYCPHVGRFAPLYGGAAVTMADFGGELSQALSDATKSPAGAAANKVYDLFVWLDGSTFRLSRGPAWTSDTVPGTGAGSTELDVVAGIQVNRFAITNGPAAQRGTYVGSIRTNASALCDLSFGSISAGATRAVLNVWNAYNRVAVATTVGDTADSWTYAAATWRQAGANAQMEVQFLQGRAVEAVEASYACVATAGAGFAATGIGLDVTTAFSGRAGYVASGATQAMTASFAATLAGARKLTALEYSSSGSGTFYGDAGSTALQGALIFKGMF